MNPNRLPVLAAAIAAALLCSAPAPAQFTNYGTGCGLTNDADTEPFLGMTYRLRTSGALPGTPVLIAFGFAPTNLPLPFPQFCTLWVDNPHVLATKIASGTGEARFALQVPIAPSLANLQVYDQWFALDPVQGNLTASDGGFSTVGDPPLVVLSVVAPPLVTVGTPVTVTVVNAGTTRTEDLCMGILAPNGERCLLRPTLITPMPGGSVIQAVVTTPPPAFGGNVVVMRGDGWDLRGPLGTDWSWIGPNLPGAGGMGQQVQSPTPPVHMPFTIQGGDVVLALGASTPSSGNARMDAHWNAGNKHYDSFLAPLSYSSLTPTQLRDTIVLPNLQAKYGVLYPGLLQITATTVGSDPAVRIHMVDNSVCSGAGGNLWF